MESIQPLQPFVLHKRHREATTCCFAYYKDQGFRAPQAPLACAQLLSLLLITSTHSNFDVLQPRMRESIDRKESVASSRVGACIRRNNLLHTLTSSGRCAVPDMLLVQMYFLQNLCAPIRDPRFHVVLFLLRNGSQAIRSLNYTLRLAIYLDDFTVLPFLSTGASFVTRSCKSPQKQVYF